MIGLGLGLGLTVALSGDGDGGGGEGQKLPARPDVWWLVDEGGQPILDEEGNKIEVEHT